MAVTGLETDSRKIIPGAVFIALRGVHTDGHAFIDAVIGKGAIAIVCETLPAQITNGITYVQVENSAIAAGFIAPDFASTTNATESKMISKSFSPS